VVSHNNPSSADFARIFCDECSQRPVLFCIFKVLSYRDISSSATVPDDCSSCSKRMIDLAQAEDCPFKTSAASEATWYGGIFSIALAGEALRCIWRWW
jgi:hypothetical protein